MFKKKSKDDANVSIITKEDRMHISGDETNERVRQWWSDNGKSIIAGVVLGVVAIVGYNYWTSYQTKQSVAAAGLFSDLLTAYEEDDMASIAKLSDNLAAEYSSSDYTAQAQGLYAIALLKQETPEVDKAVELLSSALETASNPVTKHTVRLNLAKALIEKQDFDTALAILDVAKEDGYTNQYNELKGDAYALKGDKEKAKENYQLVLDALSDSDAYREIVQIKLTNL